MADELAEINGIKPKVVLDDGEEREVASQTRYVTRWLDSKDASETVYLVVLRNIRPSGLWTITTGKYLLYVQLE